MEIKCLLNVYNAVLVSKSMYGLETLHFTEAQGKHLDKFQQRGLRKILGIPPTTIDRTTAYAEVLMKADEAKEWKEGRQVTKSISVAEVIAKKKPHCSYILLERERDSERERDRDARNPLLQVTIEGCHSRQKQVHGGELANHDMNGRMRP